VKPLITTADFAKATGIKNRLIAEGLMKFSGLHELNKLYAEACTHQGIDFVQAILAKKNITLACSEAEWQRLPIKGPFITISNHPFGGLDGLALIDLVGRRRADFKIMGNFLLKKIEPLKDFIIGVNPLEDYRQAYSSAAGMKAALHHLAGGGCLGMFPAGEVSAARFNVKQATDRAWQKPAIKLILKAGVPVVPIYFFGQNSLSFQLLGHLHPSLRTLRLPHELARAKDITLHIRIGHPIQPEELQAFDDLQQITEFLRARTYALGKVKEPSPPKLKIPNLRRPAPIADATTPDKIEADLSKIAHRKLFSQQQFDVYLAEAAELPNTLPEIGRLRELTFRQEGEGTNKEIDLDTYDNFYKHLILYDREAKQVVGAYRIGLGRDILRTYGRKGFYTYSLFKMKDGFIPILNEAIELGRSFIIPEYQNKRLPLFLLWRGILMVLLQHPEYNYIIGPVSISNYYSKVSKSLIVAFIQRNYFNHELAAFIQPRKKFRVNAAILQEAELLLKGTGNDLRKLDKVIDDIEPAIRSAPVLLKKYIQQNARIIGFNVDPKFNQALDGLMILDFRHVNRTTIENLQKEFQL
jgi:putative hemolysin